MGSSKFKEQLIKYYGITGEHPDYPVEDWIVAVTQYETRESYWDWVTYECRSEMRDTLFEPSNTNTATPSNHFYQNNLVATVSINGNNISVEGGKEAKELLKRAKRESNFCYVKDLVSKEVVQLVLDKGEWVLPSPNH